LGFHYTFGIILCINKTYVIHHPRAPEVAADDYVSASQR